MVGDAVNLKFPIVNIPDYEDAQRGGCENCQKPTISDRIKSMNMHKSYKDDEGILRQTNDVSNGQIYNHLMSDDVDEDINPVDSSSRDKTPLRP